MTLLARAAAVLVALSLGACATAPSTPMPTSLEERALARWQLMIERDFAASYDYLSEGFRATRSREDWVQELNSRPVSWTSVSHTSTECDSEDVCTVTLLVNLRTRSPVQGVGTVEVPSPARERWVRSTRGWFLVP